MEVLSEDFKKKASVLEINKYKPRPSVAKSGRG